ncbi:HOOK protein-domain-containing protein [Hyaloraphidium curvatum]|nr:HOOK protein-domain-containing protein [Hyaloraphidium curvatum]
MDALLVFLQAFPNLSRVPGKAGDLSDGLVFGEVLKAIDPRWFGGLKLEKGDNWVIKFNNLKKLFKQLTSFYEESLYQNPNNLDSVNLTAIAKENDEVELAKLGFLVVAAAVQCEGNQAYISLIRSLDEASQHAIMLAIEKVMTSLGGEDAPSGQSRLDGPDRVSSDRARGEGGEDSRVLQEKLAAVQGQYEDVLAKVGQLQLELKEAQQKLSARTDASKSEVVFRAEIDALKRNLEMNEARRHEAEGLLAEEQEQVQMLNRRLEEAARKAVEATSLKDQVDELRQVSEKLAKAEATIEKYRKRGDETVELRRQIKLLEDENRALVERSGHVEDEYRKVADSTSLAETVREELGALQQAKSRLTADLDAANAKLREAEDRVRKLDDVCAGQLDQIHSLEGQLRELELGGGIPLDDGIREPGDQIPDSQLRGALERDQKALAAATDKVADLQKALKKAKEFILNQDREIKELKASKSADQAGIEAHSARVCHSTGKIQIAVRPSELQELQNQVASKQAEIDQATAALRDMRASARREQKLLLTAFYELGLQLQKRNLAGLGAAGSSPTWLNTHRQAIDARYRK